MHVAVFAGGRSVGPAQVLAHHVPRGVPAEEVGSDHPVHGNQDIRVTQGVSATRGDGLVARAGVCRAHEPALPEETIDALFEFPLKAHGMVEGSVVFPAEAEIVQVGRGKVGVGQGGGGLNVHGASWKRCGVF